MQLVENEMKQLSFEISQNAKCIEIKWKDFFYEKHLSRALLLTIVIQLGQNLTGIDAVCVKCYPSVIALTNSDDMFSFL